MSFKPIYKLRDWINPELLVHNNLLNNPAAIHIIEKNLDKVDWSFLSSIPDAIHILEKNLDKIDWASLSQNPSIFILDTNAMRKQIDNGFAEELIARALHPKRLARELELYNYNIATEEYEDLE